MWKYNGSTNIQFVICLILLLHTASLKVPILPKFTSSLQSALFASSNKRSQSPNIGIPTRNAGSIQPAVDVGSRRRKVGPPDRSGKYNVAREEVTAAGRVSVYCIGAGLDLVALKAHVFRRGIKETVKSILAEGKDLEVNNGAILRSIPADETDEMFHVSNFPFCMPAENENSQSNSDIIGNEPSPAEGSDSDSTLVATDINQVSDLGPYSFSKAMEDEISDKQWKARETLLMATQDIFYFDYGCVVFWGLSTREEKAAISELSSFTVDPVSITQLDTSYDTLEYIYDRKANSNKPIRFDRMRLRTLQLAEKMALSYAMAQSSKLFVFESRVLDSVEATRYLPKELAKSGRIDSSKKALNQQIGELFVEQTEVNLFSSILDTPDFLWDDDEHLPAYQYTRAYLEVDDRVALLNSRLAVIRDLLDVLTGQVADSNSTRLEW
eukprot:CAMPEP_0119034330 /NCGR_PEP_ID=MMETSP1177-20130426/1317_1 /TAXON_ID=2985 /ORGANISM="Ochromonas sp, Strain CCMP1899" /LENGTH=439 /DNA_ID=CAMNT_0006991687 /DNA_START=245 /DNA_END=1561 /DNA_ORIENTATION=+